MRHAGMDLGVCNAYLPDGRCHGRIIVVREQGELLEGECSLCGDTAAIPTVKADPELRKELRLKKAGLPRQFASKRFEEDESNSPALEHIRSWLASWSADPLASLIPAPALWGLPGVGKTHLLVTVCRKLIGQCGVTVGFHSTRSLLRGLQRFEKPDEREDLWLRAVSVDVLALDDLGAEQSTDWKHDVLADLVDERYQHEHPVIVATNWAPSQWEELLDARTFSRLRGLTFPVELRGPDRRIEVLELVNERMEA